MVQINKKVARNQRPVLRATRQQMIEADYLVVRGLILVDDDRVVSSTSEQDISVFTNAI